MEFVIQSSVYEFMCLLAQLRDDEGVVCLVVWCDHQGVLPHLQGVTT